MPSTVLPRPILSALFAGGSGQAPLFGIDAAALILAFALDLGFDRPSRRGHPASDFRMRIRPCPSSPR